MKICLMGTMEFIHFRRWVQWFADQGHEVHVVAYENDMVTTDIQPVQYHSISTIEDSAVRHLPRSSRWARLSHFRKTVGQINPDVVIGHYVTYYGLPLASSGNYPKVLVAWGSDIYLAPENSKYERKMVEKSLNAADVVTTTSEALRTKILQTYKINPDKILMTPWGIDLTIFHKGYEEEVSRLKKTLDVKGPVILSSRGIALAYNNENIIRAMPNIIESNEDVKLIILRGTGTEDIESRLQELAREMKVGDNLHFVSEFIQPEELAVYLNTSDIFISIPNSDQFAGSIMEGMACGVIPVVADLDVYKLYLDDGKNAIIVNKDDPEDISKKIIWCLENLDIKESYFKINSAIITEKENWDVHARSIEKMLLDLIKEVKDDRRRDNHRRRC